MNEVFEQKKDLRTKTKAQRGMWDAEEQQSASALLYNTLSQTISLRKPCTIAGYAAAQSEIPLFSLLTTLHQQGHNICLPIVEPDSKILSFHHWHPASPLHTKAFGIAEPNPSQPCIPDIIFLPLLACDQQGYRLGYGGGYYDATIANLYTLEHDPLLIGVGYDFQYIDHIPHESHDKQLHAFLSPERLLWFSPSHQQTYQLLN